MKRKVAMAMVAAMAMSAFTVPVFAEDAEAGAYIQGYAENPKENELKADVILVKELV